MASETNAATDFVQEQDIIVLAAAAVVVLVLCGVCCCCTGFFSGIARRLGCRKTVRDCCSPFSNPNPSFLCASSRPFFTLSPPLSKLGVTQTRQGF